MPELPDIEAYLEALRPRVVGAELLGVRVGHPFLLRTVDPAPDAALGCTVDQVARMGKRIVLVFSGDLFFVLHLMIAGRLHWFEPAEGDRAHMARPRRSSRSELLSLQFAAGSLVLTEAGSRRRASLHVVAGGEVLQTMNPGGVEVLECSATDFRDALVRENHTLKRALTDPRLVSGIGNAYSDEILHAARLSPLALTQTMGDEGHAALHEAAVEVLSGWTERLRAEARAAFPEHVTAFRPEMAVHGRYGEPCPVCGTAVQRIRYAENEADYCPRCQTGGRLLADRGLSRLLKADWPRTIDELERQGSLRTRPRT